ncbi:MAG: ATP synthase subunit B [Gemmatales bacterium]|nr:MAG: ATP synthase subunit B [Gemmatales bacterium]
MIDWFTTVAQIVNFLILVALLRYFLYGRIVAAMQQREDELAARWEEAERLREQAQEELAAAESTRRQLEDQREALLAEIRAEVNQFRQEMLARVRQEMDQQRQRWASAIQEERESFLRDLRRTVAEQVVQIARRVLADLAGVQLERQIVAHFVDRLRKLGSDDRAALIDSLHRGDRAVTVETSFDVDDQQRAVLVQAIRALLAEPADGPEGDSEPDGSPDDIEVHFQRSEDLLCGIAVSTNSHQVSWNLRHYLIELEQELQRALDEEAAAQVQLEADATVAGQSVRP